MKHTKGKWHSCCLDNKPHFIFAGEDGKAICTILHNDPNEPNYESMEGIVTKEECVANAKLIQAAPDMLKELQHIVERINRVAIGSVGSHVSEAFCQALRDRANEVIKKAIE